MKIKKIVINKLSGFSLAEAMITLLIVSLILAAVVPVVSKRQSTPDKIWNYTQSGVGSDQADVYWGLRDGQTALIGGFSVPDAAVGSRLTLITSPDDATQTNEALKYAIRRPILAFYQRTSATSSTRIGKISFDQNSNIAIGTNALKNNYTGTNNTAIGTNALVGNGTTLTLNTGNHNVAVGNNAMFNSYYGGFTNSNDWNTALGNSALYNNQGTSNVGVGINALYTNTTGVANTAVGTNAMFAAVDNGTANSNDSNTALGASALYYNRGFNNVGVGVSSLANVSTGSTNTAIGANSCTAINAGTGNICLGNGAGPTGNQSNKLYIDNAQTNTPLIGADFSTRLITYTLGTNGNVYLGPGYDFGFDGGTDSTFLLNNVGAATGRTSISYNGTENLIVYNNGTTVWSRGGYTASDKRWKKNITPLNSSLENVLKLQGVNYNWKKKEFPKKPFDDSKQIGLIAQDVEKIYPELVFTDYEGYKNLDYSKFTPILIESIKELHAMFIVQKTKLADFETLITQKISEIAKKIITIENKLLQHDKQIKSLLTENQKLKQQNKKLQSELNTINSRLSALEKAK